MVSQNLLRQSSKIVLLSIVNPMRKTALNLNALLLVMLAGCAMTQQPATVTDSAANDAPKPSVSKASELTPNPSPPQTPSVGARATPIAAASVNASSVKAPDGIAVDRLASLAKLRQKNPAALKQYLGQTLHGQAKFVKTAKGNPNAVVADVRVNGVGEVSLWCRNVISGAAPNRVVGFEGTFTGEVYTSEDFSHDVTLKDCRFRD